jgi:HSP20 family protein
MNQLIRHRPLREAGDLRREVSRMFEDIWPFREGGEEGYEAAVWSPRVDLAETAEEYVISMDLPGVNKDEVNINFENNQLIVSGERKEEHKKEDRNFYRIERAHGRFLRYFNLPKEIDPDKIAARFDNGVLSVHVPKAEVSKPRQIKVS